MTKEYKIVFIFLILSFIILIPFISEKYTYLLDIPRIEPDIFYGKISPIYGGFLYLIPMEIYQKLIFASILFLSGYSMYILARRILLSTVTSFYTGFLYMINPYTYIRILTGHWHIIISYVIIPFLLIVFIDLLEKRQKKEMIKFIFLLSIVAFNIHMLIISLIMMTIIFLLWSNKYRDIRITKLFAMSGILFILLNSYWIIPVLTAKNTMIDNIGEEDFKVFSPKIDNLPDLFDIASMYGFWREGYIYAKDFIPYWQLLSLFIILLVIYGFISFYQDEKIGYIVKALGIIWIIGFVLATGINGPFGDLNHWLYDNTIFKGFRDSHKFVAMIVLAYAILGGLGIEKLSKNARMK